jgi:hypothetical protein
MKSITHVSLRLAYIAGSLLVILTACRNPSAPERELNLARRRWAQQQPHAYTLTVSRSCECLPEMSGPVVVVVRDGQVESRHYVSSGEPVTSTYAGLFPIVEGLFALIDEALRQDAAKLDVDYDPTLGYPVRIAIDRDATMVDDEVTYNAELRTP